MLSKAEIITLRSGSKNNCLNPQSNRLFYILHKTDNYGENLTYLTINCIAYCIAINN